MMRFEADEEAADLSNNAIALIGVKRRKLIQE
jgi:hypothetical protein